MNESTWRDEDEKEESEWRWRGQSELQELLLKADPWPEQLAGYDFAKIETRVFSKIYELSRSEESADRKSSKKD